MEQPYWISNTQVYGNQNEAHVQNKTGTFPTWNFLKVILRLAVREPQTKWMQYGQ